MKRITIAIMLAALLLLVMPTAASAAGITVVNKTGDGIWINNTWQVSIYPGEVKSTVLTLHNSSNSSLGVEVIVVPDSLDGGNLTFELDKANFTMPGGSSTDVTLAVKANGSAAPGLYTAQLEIKSEVAPTPPPPSGGGGFVPDTTPPKISGIWHCEEGITETTADICWTTNEASTSQVEYWNSPSMLSPLDEAYVLEHHIQLADLTPGTTYYYRTMSGDRAGNLAVSDEYTFTTLGKEEVAPVEPSPPPPEEEEPEVVKPEEEEPEVIEPEEEEVIPYIPPEKPKPETPWTVIGSVIGGLIVVGGVGYWLWRRITRKEKPGV